MTKIIEIKFWDYSKIFYYETNDKFRKGQKAYIIDPKNRIVEVTVERVTRYKDNPISGELQPAFKTYSQAEEHKRTYNE